MEFTVRMEVKSPLGVEIIREIVVDADNATEASLKASQVFSKDKG